MESAFGKDFTALNLDGHWRQPTAHGRKRLKQRAIRDSWAEIVESWGTTRHCGRGCVTFSFDRKTWAQFEKAMGPEAKAYERARNIYVVISEDGRLVTAAHRWN